MARLERAALTAALTLVVATIAGLSLTLSPVARAVPLVVALPTLALLGVEFARDLAHGNDAGAPPPQVSRAERVLIVWLVLLVALIGCIGVPLGAPAWCALFLRFRSGERWPLAVLLGSGLATVLYAILVLLLRIRLTAGSLVDWPG